MRDAEILIFTPHPGLRTTLSLRARDCPLIPAFCEIIGDNISRCPGGSNASSLQIVRRIVHCNVCESCLCADHWPPHAWHGNHHGHHSNGWWRFDGGRASSRHL